MTRAPVIEWHGDHVMAYIELPGIGELRFNKFGSDSWYAEDLGLIGGQALPFVDWSSEGSPPVPDSQLLRILDIALDQLPWIEEDDCPKGCDSLRKHAEHVQDEERRALDASFWTQA